MKRSEGLQLRTIGRVHLLVVVGSTVTRLQGIVTLNETARFLWEQIDEHRCPEDLAQALAETFEVDVAVARRDVEHVLAHLVRLGAIV